MRRSTNGELCLVSIARAIFGGFRPNRETKTTSPSCSFNRKGDSWGVQAQIVCRTAGINVTVSIARAILGGFRPKRVAELSRWGGVSIARAILGGFRPMRGRTMASS